MCWKQWILSVCLAGASLTLVAAPASASGKQPLNETFAAYATLLEKHLVEKVPEGGGLVSAFDYDAALQDPQTRALLDEQNRRMAGFDRTTMHEQERAVAFWINAYNYFMLYYILENPHRGSLISSVRDYGNLFNPYRVFGRDEFDIGGRKFSLSEMEKEILLGDEFKARGWKDARVHFAVNCASVSCPPLRVQIYLPENLDDLLTENTRRALKTHRHFHLEGNILRISQLFEWYEKDYVEDKGSVQAFLKAYGDREVQEAVERANSIKYISYDWDLNRPENFPEFAH